MFEMLSENNESAKYFKDILLRYCANTEYCLLHG